MLLIEVSYANQDYIYIFDQNTVKLQYCILFKFCGGKAEFSAAITPVFSVTLSFRDNFFSLLLILKTVMFNVPSKLRNKATHRT